MSEADAARIIELLELIERHGWWTYLVACCILGLQAANTIIRIVSK